LLGTFKVWVRCEIEIAPMVEKTSVRYVCIDRSAWIFLLGLPGFSLIVQCTTSGNGALIYCSCTISTLFVQSNPIGKERERKCPLSLSCR